MEQSSQSSTSRAIMLADELENDMSATVTILPCETTLDIPMDRVLEAAIGVGIEQGMVIGWNEEGLLYMASTTSNVPEMIFLLEKAKLQLLAGG